MRQRGSWRAALRCDAIRPRAGCAAMSMNRKLLDHLLHSGIIDATQLQSAMAKQRLSGADVLEILLLNRMVSEVDLARGLGSFYKYKVVDIAQVVPKADALERAEAEFCRRHQLLPFAIDRNTGDLLVAIADPSKAVGALDAFQAKTGLNIRPYVAPRFALGAAIDRAFDGASKSSFTGGRLQPVKREISSIGSVPAIADARQGSRGPVAGGRSSTPFASEDSFEPKRRGASNLFGTNDSSGLFGDESLEIGRAHV